MQYGDEIQIFGLDWALIHFVENPGMAFGITLTDNYLGKLALSIFRIIAVILLFVYIRFLLQTKANWGVLVSFALIMAGAIGNIIDSAFYGIIFSESYYHGGIAEVFPKDGGYAPFLYGKVVDMLYFPVWNGYFPEWIPLIGGKKYMFFKPVFNIADVAITLGVINILFFQRSFFTGKSHEEEEAATDNEKAESSDTPIGDPLEINDSNK